MSFLKNKKLSKLSIIIGAFFALAIGAAATLASTSPAQETKAYYTPSTHYEVSDTASELASYYSSISDSDSGTSLLSKLQSLNSTKRKKTVGYSGIGTDTSGAVIYTDYDLNNTATDSNGQTYGTKVASFYTKTSATSWNREHMWPNSHGGNNVEADILHTRPTISSENSSRGNSFYVEGKNSSSAGWDPYTAGYDIAVRGECARVILYCVVAYPSFTLSDADSHSTSNSNKDNMMGNMNTLIKWHYDYSPNVYEMNRNNGAEYLQGNRNPFVDHPEYVGRIWSNFNSTVSTLVSNNQSMYDNWTPGSYSDYGKNDAVNNTTSGSLTISSSTASLTVGETTQIYATSSDGSNISWSITSGSSYVSISPSSTVSGSSGKITIEGLAAGEATIKATATIGGETKTKTCTVTVSASGSSTVTGDSTIVPSDLTNGSYPTTDTTYTTATGSMSITAYNTANFSSKVQFKKSGGYIYNNSSLNLDSLTINGLSGTITVYGGTTKNPSSTTITGSNGTYDLSGYNYFKIINNSSSVATCSSISITLAAASTKTLSSVSIGGDPTTSYYTGDTFSFDGTLTATYSDNTSKTVTPTTVSTPDMSTAGQQTITVSYTEGGVTKSDTYTITVTAKTLSSLTKSGTLTKSTYYVGETFESSGLSFTAHFNDGSTASVAASSLTFSPSPLTAGTTQVSASYTVGGTTKSVTITGITVLTKTLTSLTYTGTPTKTTYQNGESFNPSGLTITATFNGGSETVTDLTWSPSPLTTGTTSVTGTYTYGGVSKTITINGLTVTEVTQTYTVTISKSNSGLSTTETSTDTNKSYAIGTTGKTLDVVWGSGIKNNGTYDELTFSTDSDSILTPSCNAKVKSITVDNFKYTNNLTIKADGVEVSGVAGTSTSNDNSKVMVYTFTSATSDWSITHATKGSYSGSFYTLDFEITELPHDVSVSGVTINPQAASIAVGGSQTLTATVLPNDASNKAVTWSTSDSSKATVSNGTVTGVAAGSAIITATTQDGGYTATCYVSVTAASSSSTESFDITFTNSASDGSSTLNGTTIKDSYISSGSTYVNTITTATKIYAGKTGLKFGSSGNAGDLAFSTTSALQAQAITSITISATKYGSDNQDFTLYVNGNQVGTATSNGGDTVTLSSATTITSFEIKTGSGRAYLSGISFNYSVASSSTGYTADDFAMDFINSITCNVNGTSEPTMTKTWTEIQELYASIDLDSEKALITGATYEISGSGSSTEVTGTNGTTYIVALAMSRYDIIVSKYSAKYTNFLNRPAAQQTKLFLMNTDANSSLTLITLVSIISISTLCGFVYLAKKRKEHE